MEKKVVIWGKTFVPYISNARITKAISDSAAKINEYYKDAEDESAPIFISILNGAFMYTADLLREITVPCEVSFVKVASYKGEYSTGSVTELIGINHSIKGRDVIIMDDIVDTGYTMKELCKRFAEMEARSIKVAALIYKKHTCCSEVKVDFPCITMTDSAFIVGYGLDYNEIGRNLKEIYILEQ